MGAHKMKLKFLKRGLNVLFLLILMMSQLTAQSEKLATEKCEFRGESGKYKLIFLDETQDENGISVFLHIKLNAKKYKKTEMVKLAKRLFAEYCKADELLVAIFESEKDSGLSLLPGYIIGKPIVTRGYYSFNRKTGENGIEYSTKKGNPTTEIQIDLSESLQNTSSYKKYYLDSTIEKKSPQLRTFFQYARFPFVFLESDGYKEPRQLVEAFAWLEGNSSCDSGLVRKIQDQWVKEFKQSLAIEVLRSNSLKIDKNFPASKSFFWINSGDENLNVRLVESGACPSAAMLIPDTERENLLVRSELYEEFRLRILDAERKSKEAKSSISDNR